jgi:hypothetical protein
MPITLQSTRWVRLAAIVALVAGASVLTIGVYTVAEDFEELMWVLGFLFVVAFFAWLVLIRRGLARVLGVPAGLLAIAGLIAIGSASCPG